MKERQKGSGTDELLYDAGNRLLASVDVGTNGGVMTSANGGLDLTTDLVGDGIPDVLQMSPPARSDTVLVTSYTYNDQGLTDTVTDPKGILSKSFYDSLSRTTYTVAAWDGSYDPTTGAHPTSANQNQTTAYTFDAAGHMGGWVVQLTPVIRGIERALNETPVYRRSFK